MRKRNRELIPSSEFKCGMCGKHCDILREHWTEKGEAWGAPYYQDYYEDYSACCEADLEPTEDDDER